MKENKSYSLILASAVNIIGLICFVVFFHPFYETTDDVAMALLIEGAYGQNTGYIVFENLIWGKIVSTLAMLVPNVKWYVVLQYMMIFFAFLGMSYSFIRKQGKKIGLVSSIVVLYFFGIQTYVAFQWTKTAAIATVGGMILLYFSFDSADKGVEKVISRVCGSILCIFGSMIRFQFFAVCVVLTGAIAIFHIWKLWKDKSENWIRELFVYVASFILLGVICCSLYVADTRFYTQSEEWKNYVEYNALRSELWDMGFPSYVENQELYNSLGISANDIEYYSEWNIDQELLSADVLRELVEAKVKPVFSMETMKGYFEQYPKRFFLLPIFQVFLIVSSIAIALKRKNIYFVLYEIIAVMLFELYFFFLNRYGLARIENGMWMAAIATVIYGMSDELSEIYVKTKKWIVMSICIVLAINIEYASVNIFGETKDTTYAREFFETISDDSDNLYLFLMYPEPYNYYESYDFWETAEIGDASNIYYIGGWEFNLPVKNEILKKYGINNVYRDSIDNPNIYIVTTSGNEKLQTYIQENYNEKAVVQLEKEILGQKIWRVRTE